jgi:hypothetical protein
MRLKYEPSSAPLQKSCSLIEDYSDRYGSQFKNSPSYPSWLGAKGVGRRAEQVRGLDALR